MHSARINVIPSLIDESTPMVTTKHPTKGALRIYPSFRYRSLPKLWSCTWGIFKNRGVVKGQAARNVILDFEDLAKCVETPMRASRDVLDCVFKASITVISRWRWVQSIKFRFYACGVIFSSVTVRVRRGDARRTLAWLYKGLTTFWSNCEVMTLTGRFRRIFC